LFRTDTFSEVDLLGWPTSNAYVAAGSRSFLAAVSARDPNTPPITVVLNWPALMKR